MTPSDPGSTPASTYEGRVLAGSSPAGPLWCILTTWLDPAKSCWDRAGASKMATEEPHGSSQGLTMMMIVVIGGSDGDHHHGSNDGFGGDGGDNAAIDDGDHNHNDYENINYVVDTDDDDDK